MKLMGDKKLSLAIFTSLPRVFIEIGHYAIFLRSWNVVSGFSAPRRVADDATLNALRYVAAHVVDTRS